MTNADSLRDLITNQLKFCRTRDYADESKNASKSARNKMEKYEIENYAALACELINFFAYLCVSNFHRVIRRKLRAMDSTSPCVLVIDTSITSTCTTGQRRKVEKSEKILYFIVFDHVSLSSYICGAVWDVGQFPHTVSNLRLRTSRLITFLHFDISRALRRPCLILRLYFFLLIFLSFIEAVPNLGSFFLPCPR